MVGAVAGVVGAGYAGASYHQQRKQAKEDRKKEEDAELGLRSIQPNQGEVMISNKGETHPEAESGDIAYAHGWTGMR